MISPPISPLKPLSARDVRTVHAQEFVESQSIKKIVTRLRSTEFTKTTIHITETKRFEDGIVKHPKIDCGADKFVLLIKPEMYGSKLNFHVTQLDVERNTISDVFQFDVNAVLSKAEMEAFMENIEFMINPDSMIPARFYRVNGIEDEDRCLTQNGGCYEHMRKMKSGHQASPLYDQVNVIYFSCRPKDDKGTLPSTSFFGRNLRAFPVNTILNKNSVAFLAGMHCYLSGKKQVWYRRAHYPSILVCQRDSATYQTCLRLGLKLLDWATNNFLRWNQETGELLCATQLRMLKHMGSRYNPHPVYVEIMLADTSVRITDGEHRWCIIKKSNGKHKSCIECTVCCGWMENSENKEINEVEKTLKRVGQSNSENLHPSPEKILRTVE